MDDDRLDRPILFLEDAVTATRILVNEDILDVFGHVSVRDPVNPARFWLTSAMPPSRVVGTSAYFPFDLEGRVLARADAALFSERFIHAAIYSFRKDVTAICHHHAMSIMPFCLGGPTLRALSQTGAFLGTAVPVWDSRTAFGDTAMLVSNLAQARDLATTLGNGSVALMRGHGMVVAGTDAADLVFRCIHACKEAQTLVTGLSIGPVMALSQGEIAAVGEPSAAIVARGWAHWTAFLPESKDVAR